ncbi:MAG: glutamine--fructose-6-phosphate transaminase (isomerizing) [Chaenotheca gracillima]|nr:MAG: glutamine--fructose-6-phosphate transaminase (isomerizing) [Chaenotheca gracillima]
MAADDRFLHRGGTDFRAAIPLALKRRPVWLTAVLLFIVMNVTIFNHSLHHQQELSPQVQPTALDLPQFPKPSNVTISGLVFFGRRDRVQSMSCYIEVRISLPYHTLKERNMLIDYIMQRNLVDNGGWLDEVLWVVNTEDVEDLKYLEKVLAMSPRYKKLDLWVQVKSTEYRQIWKHLERGKMYVKLDDDVVGKHWLLLTELHRGIKENLLTCVINQVWLADDAIPRMVEHKLKNPDDFAVSANVINNPPLSFLHYHFGALHPYFPELNDKGTPVKKPKHFASWKASDHPYWEGPDDFRWDLKLDPPAKGHRWLRVEDDKAISRTPIADVKYAMWGYTYRSWAIAAQQHYSFLENLEKGQLDLYKFQRPWSMTGERIRINALVVWADDILDSDIDSWQPDKSDEEMIVMELPKKFGRPVTIEGTALASHFNFQHQKDVAKTDLLARYRAYALENACLTKPPDY